MDRRPWYDEAFEAGYLEVYPHRDLASARREVEALIARGLRGRVLDLGCGHGRHLGALLERGVEAFGLDRSRALAGRADPPARGRIALGDFRALPFRSSSFGTVLMLFSSFGYFEDPENERALAEAARVLAPGGIVVLDLMNPARVRATLVPESHARRGALEVRERRGLAPDGKRVVKDVCLREAGGGERRWREDVRLYEEHELGALLRAAGLERLRTEGDYDGRAFEAGSPRQIVWARKG